MISVKGKQRYWWYYLIKLKYDVCLITDTSFQMLHKIKTVYINVLFLFARKLDGGPPLAADLQSKVIPRLKKWHSKLADSEREMPEVKINFNHPYYLRKLQLCAVWVLWLSGLQHANSPDITLHNGCYHGLFFLTIILLWRTVQFRASVFSHFKILVYFCIPLVIFCIPCWLSLRYRHLNWYIFQYSMLS